MNYEEKCHNFITAVFKLQDRCKEGKRLKPCSHDLRQEIEGDDR